MSAGSSVRRTRQDGHGRLSALYGAVFEIAAMKASLADLHPDLAPAEADRLALKIERVERLALDLLEAVEAGASALGH